MVDRREPVPRRVCPASVGFGVAPIQCCDREDDPGAFGGSNVGGDVGSHRLVVRSVRHVSVDPGAVGERDDLRRAAHAPALAARLAAAKAEVDPVVASGPWFAGAGVKPGSAHGQSDEWSWKAAEGATTPGIAQAPGP